MVHEPLRFQRAKRRKVTSRMVAGGNVNPHWWTCLGRTGTLHSIWASGNGGALSTSCQHAASQCVCVCMCPLSTGSNLATPKLALNSSNHSERRRRRRRQFITANWLTTICISFQSGLDTRVLHSHSCPRAPSPIHPSSSVQLAIVVVGLTWRFVSTNHPTNNPSIHRRPPELVNHAAKRHCAIVPDYCSDILASSSSSSSSSSFAGMEPLSNVCSLARWFVARRRRIRGHTLTKTIVHRRPTDQ